MNPSCLMCYELLIGGTPNALLCEECIRKLQIRRDLRFAPIKDELLTDLKALVEKYEVRKRA